MNIWANMARSRKWSSINLPFWVITKINFPSMQLSQLKKRPCSVDSLSKSINTKPIWSKPVSVPLNTAHSLFQNKSARTKSVSTCIKQFKIKIFTYKFLFHLGRCVSRNKKATITTIRILHQKHGKIQTWLYQLINHSVSFNLLPFWKVRSQGTCKAHSNNQEE